MYKAVKLAGGIGEPLVTCSSLSIFYPVFFVFVFRLLRICVTVFFATYLLLHIHIVYSSALLKQCSGAIVRFSDSSSFSYFSLKPYVVTPHLNYQMAQMRVSSR